jgi:hypothetical protein
MTKAPKQLRDPRRHSDGFSFPVLLEPEELEALTPQQARFLECRAQTYTDSAACGKLGLSQSTVVRWKHESEAFLAAYAAARNIPVDRLEQALYHRALYGHSTLRLDKAGNPIPMIDPVTLEVMLDDDFEPIYVADQVPNDNLLLAALKAQRPEYRDKGELHVGGIPGAPLEHSVRVEYVLPDGATMDDYRRRWSEEDAAHGSQWPEGS